MSHLFKIVNGELEPLDRRERSETDRGLFILDLEESYMYKHRAIGRELFIIMFFTPFFQLPALSSADYFRGSTASRSTARRSTATMRPCVGQRSPSVAQRSPSVAQRSRRKHPTNKRRKSGRTTKKEKIIMSGANIFNWEARELYVFMTTLFLGNNPRL